MEVEMMAGITVSTVVDFLRMKCLVKCFCHMIDIFNVSGAFLSGQFSDLTDMFFVSDDHTAFVALLLEKINF